VAAWRVLEGDSPHGLRPTLTVSREGFETTISLRPRARLLAVQALDRRGAPLGKSAVVAG
jgi:hypothetical protein